LQSQAQLRPRSLQNVEGRLRNHVLPYFEDAPLSGIRPDHFRKWLARLQEKSLSGDTVVATYRVLSRIMRTAEIDRFISRSPCIGIELPSATSHGEMRFLSPEEVGALADAVPERYRTLVYFAAYTGLRWGEIAALRVDDVNILKGTVDVRKSMSELNGRIQVGPTKTGKRRTVSLPRFLCVMLGEHIGRFPTESGCVFSSPRGGPLRRNFYRRQFLTAVAQAGFAPLRFHDLRHTAASLAIANSAHPKEIQERLRHSTIRVTLDRYGHLFPTLDERLRDGLEETYRDAELNRRVGNAWEMGEGEPTELAGQGTE